MKRLNYFDDSFDIGHTNNYEVTIQLGLDGYSFCVNSLLDNKCVAIGLENFEPQLHFNDLPSKLSEVLAMHAFMSRTFSKVNFVYTGLKSTLVPRDLFSPEVSRKYFEFNHELETDENIESQVLRDISVAQIFTCPASLASIVVNKYKDVHFYTQSSALLTEMVAYSKRQKEARAVVLAHFSSSHLLDIVVASPSGVKLHNTFELRGPVDALYYITYVYQQLQLKSPRNSLFLSGQIEPEDAVYKSLATYFPQMAFYTNINKQYSFRIGKHRLLHLINL